MRCKKLLSGENFFHRLCGEKKPSPLPAERGKKTILTANVANLTNIHRANFNAYLKLTENFMEVRDR